MCLSRFNWSSTIIPRTFLLVICLVFWSPVVTSGLLWGNISNLCREPRIIYLVLSLFSARLLASSNLWTFSWSAFSFCVIWKSDLPLQLKFVSSANNASSVVSKQFGKSILQIRNSSGPRIDLLGTPQYNFCALDDSWFSDQESFSLVLLSEKLVLFAENERQANKLKSTNCHRDTNYKTSDLIDLIK